ncbi:hypothetical protein SteCoe_17323 [Stentor coeruleus]|uniref:PH domain-containing protein n=1 Tax=Stentor coeruleus TaxID=5963 RepID=A0A1R2BZB7_9CILI|nr:hypothetical protein SteCoe_17323 [Stentor coeruleus]
MFHDDFGIEETQEDYPPAITRNTRNSIISSAEKSGWLKKRSKKSSNFWVFRYFAFVDNKLYYYKTPSEKIPLGVYNFDQISFDLQVLPKSNPNMLILVPLNSSHQLCLKSSNLSDLQEWASVLCSSILQSYGKHNNLSSLSSKAKFWKREIVFSKDLPGLSETGDLLLIKSFNQKTQNFSYEHIAFLIKYPDQGLGVLHLSSSNDINILMWDDFIESFKTQQNFEILLRKLRVERTDEMLLKLEEFVKKVDKKKYRLSPVELLQRTNSDNISEEIRGYSAELVASIFKYLGLLSSDIPANMFSPEDFSIDRNLVLMGARLSGNSLIEFDID